MNIHDLRYAMLRGWGRYLGLIRPIPKKILKRLESQENSFNGFFVRCGLVLDKLYPNLGSGFNVNHCHDRAMQLTMAFDEFNLVTGDLTEYARTSSGLDDEDKGFEHSWVESKGWCYDTTFNIRARSWFYKSLFGAVEHVRSNEKEMFQKSWYMEMRNRTNKDVESDTDLNAGNAILLKYLLETALKDERAQRHRRRAQQLQHLIDVAPNVDKGAYLTRLGIKEKPDAVIGQDDDEQLGE